MKTSSSSPYTYSLPRLVETEGLHKTYHRLCELAFTLMEDSRALLRNAHDIARAARALIKAERHNDRIITKWEMLLTPSWRKRVLRDLGGIRALRRWERRADRAARRRVGLPMVKPHASAAQREARAANLAKAKAAMKAKHFKGVRRACWDNTHPNVFLDRVKVDMEGLFRLAPIERGTRVTKTKVKAKPRHASTNLWNRKPKEAQPERRLKYTKLNPISLWPIEFEAMGDYKHRPQPTSPSVIPHVMRDQLSDNEGNVEDARINVPQVPKTDSAPAEKLSVPAQGRDDKVGGVLESFRKQPDGGD